MSSIPSHWPSSSLREAADGSAPNVSEVRAATDNLNNSGTQPFPALRGELQHFAEWTLRKDLLVELRAQLREDMREELQSLQKSLGLMGGRSPEDPDSGNEQDVDDDARLSNAYFGSPVQHDKHDHEDHRHHIAAGVSPATKLRLSRHLNQGRPSKIIKISNNANANQMLVKRQTHPHDYSNVLPPKQIRQPVLMVPETPKESPPALPPIPNFAYEGDDTEGDVIGDEGGRLCNNGNGNGVRPPPIQTAELTRQSSPIASYTDSTHGVQPDTQIQPWKGSNRKVNFNPSSANAEEAMPQTLKDAASTDLGPGGRVSFICNEYAAQPGSDRNNFGDSFDRQTSDMSNVDGEGFARSSSMVGRASTDFGGQKTDEDVAMELHSSEKLKQRMEVGRSCRNSRQTMFNEFMISSRQRAMKRFVAHPVFEYTIGIFLFLNALAIGFRAQYRAQNPALSAPDIYTTFELAFGIVFTSEILLKFFAYRCNFLRMKGWQWNMFDLIVVSLQDAEFIIDVALKGASKSKLEDFSFMRLLRLGRIVRLLRMVRLIPELKSMVYLVAASMQSFFWTMVLLALLMFGVAVHLTEVVADYRGSNADSTVGEMMDRSQRLEDAWGTLMSSIVSLYQAILGGIDWKELMDDVEKIGWSVPVIFMMYIAFGVLVMLNLVTGVFVEGAQRIVAEDRDAELVKQAKKIFAIVDDSDDNIISWREFQSHLEDSSMATYFSLLGMSRSDAKDLFRLLDLDCSGSLSIKEFVHGCLSLRGNAKSLDLARIAYNFELHDKQVKAIDEKLQQLYSRVAGPPREPGGRAP